MSRVTSHAGRDTRDAQPVTATIGKASSYRQVALMRVASVQPTRLIDPWKRSRRTIMPRTRAIAADEGDEQERVFRDGARRDVHARGDKEQRDEN